MQNSASESRDSFLEFGVYSSSGRLLHGSEKFKEAWEHSELAKQLDIKRSALYAEVRSSEVLLGCSLLVKIHKGREERAVFMECLPEEIVTREPGWIDKFYTDAKTRTEELQSIRYQVIGLWKEGDLFSLSPQESSRTLTTSLERKILSGEQVSIWTPDLPDGISFLACLISRLKHIDFQGFSLALSLYPSGTDISAGPGETDPDFTLERGEVRASEVPDEKVNPEEAIGQIQKEVAQEQKIVYSPDSAPDPDIVSGRDSSKTQKLSPKKSKTRQKEKIAGYTCCFLLFLIAGLLLLPKAGLELPFPSLSVSINSDRDSFSFQVQLETMSENSSKLKETKDENKSETRLQVSGSPSDSSSNLSQVPLYSKTGNLSPQLQDIRKETSNKSEVNNKNPYRDSAGNESMGNGATGNRSMKNEIPENESIGNGILENRNGTLENRTMGNELLENKSSSSGIPGNERTENENSENESKWKESSGNENYSYEINEVENETKIAV